MGVEDELTGAESEDSFDFPGANHAVEVGIVEAEDATVKLEDGDIGD